MSDASRKFSSNLSDLADLLRSEDHHLARLTDVASIAEVPIKCMESYLASIDTTMYGRIKSLANHIKQARLDIGRARPNEITSDRIPRAGKELDAIVRAIEEAANTIMEAAETIMSADFSNAEAKAEVEEAYSFQGITGQRISKAVRILTFIADWLGTVDGFADEPSHEGGASIGDEAL